MSLITISGSIGSGGAAVARQVAKALDITLFDDDRLQGKAVEMGIDSEDLKSLDEKAPGLFDRILNRRPGLYVAFMESVVLEVARNGNGVILGHGSQILLRDFSCALHVLVQADPATRIGRLVTHQGLSRVVAERLSHKRDSEQNGFFRFAFHKDLSDPSLYDLVLSTEKMGLELSARLIVAAAGSDEINTCSLNALLSMERLSRVKSIEAILQKKNINLAMIHIDVGEDGKAVVSGVVPNEDERRRLMAAVKEIPGSLEVQTEVAALPAGI